MKRRTEGLAAGGLGSRLAGLGLSRGRRRQGGVSGLLVPLVLALVWGLVALFVAGERAVPLLVVVLDGSGSLAVPPEKLPAVEAAIAAVVERGVGRWTVAAFVASGDGLRVSPPTPAADWRAALVGDGPPRGGADLWDSVERAAQTVPAGSGMSCMLVVTDGPSGGGGATVADAVAACKGGNLSVVVMRVGAEAPRDPLERLARETGGLVVDAVSPGALRREASAAADAVAERLGRPVPPAPTRGVLLLWAVGAVGAMGFVLGRRGRSGR